MSELTSLMLSQLGETAVGVGGSISQAGALRASQDASSGWSRLQQEQALRAGDLAGSRARAQYGQLESRQRVGYAASGLSLASGSAQTVMGETRALGDIERLRIQQDAYNQALGLRAQDTANRYQTSQAISSKYIGLGANVAGAGLKLADTAYKYDQENKKLTSAQQRERNRIADTPYYTPTSSQQVESALDELIRLGGKTK